MNAGIRTNTRSWISLAVGVCTLTGCFGSGGGGDSSGPSADPVPISLTTPNPVPSNCAAIAGASWSPSVPGATALNHDATVAVSTTSTTLSGPVIGLAQASAGAEITTRFSVTQALGAFGSITLQAINTTYPGDLQGAAYPMLVSLIDPNGNEYIHLKRNNAGGDCLQSGYYTCAGGSCSANPNCSISAPSAYADRSHWEQHQILGNSAVNYPSVNTFPTCNWAGGVAGSISNPSCAFNTDFAPVLPLGTYTAKYVLIADSYATLLPIGTYSAAFNLKVIQKKDANAAVGGAIDLNVILVGDKNVQDSRTPAGQNNLNTLFTNLGTYYSQASTNVQIGNINVIEWPCTTGGDFYSDLATSDLGTMFRSATSLFPSGTEGKALNIFIISNFQSPDPSLIIDGISGAIGGSVMNGTDASGVAFASFDHLTTDTASDLSDLASTMAHEMGHYLGLNHPSERDGTSHDIVRDTPVCTTTEDVGGGTFYITNHSCSLDTNVSPITGNSCADVCGGYDGTTTVCPAQTECQFNHIMWWTSKNTTVGGQSDGEIFSTNSGGIINYNAFIQ